MIKQLSLFNFKLQIKKCDKTISPSTFFFKFRFYYNKLQGKLECLGCHILKLLNYLFLNSALNVPINKSIHDLIS